MKKTIFATALAAAAILTSCTQSVSPEQTWKELEKPLNFYLINDSGRNGYYEQKTIAETMGMILNLWWLPGMCIISRVCAAFPIRFG